MSLHQIRWPVVILSLAITLAALFGAGFVLKSRTVEEPLRQVYASSPLVDSYTIDRPMDTYEIRLRLKEVPDLAEAYQQLNEKTNTILKGLPYTIIIEDRRSAQQTEAFRRINLYVQEALATGKFADMADRIEQEAAKAGLKARFSVDQERVYLQLNQADGSYLYSVLDRPVNKPATVTEGGENP